MYHTFGEYRWLMLIFITQDCKSWWWISCCQKLLISPTLNYESEVVDRQLLWTTAKQRAEGEFTFLSFTQYHQIRRVVWPLPELFCWRTQNTTGVIKKHLHRVPQQMVRHTQPWSPHHGVSVRSHEGTEDTETDGVHRGTAVTTEQYLWKALFSISNIFCLKMYELIKPDQIITPAMIWHFKLGGHWVDVHYTPQEGAHTTWTPLEPAMK